MSFKQRIIDRIIKDPYVLIFWLCKYSGISSISDWVKIKTSWRINKGYHIDLKNPRTFSEKLEWMKLFDRNPEYTTWVDKYLCKEKVKEIIGEEIIIKTLKVWNKSSDICVDNLPDKFVLKCTHDSGSVYICKDRAKINLAEIRKKFAYFLRRNYYSLSMEWPYKNVPHRIIAEEFIESNDQELIDYKFYCFNGYVDCVMVCTERSTGYPKFYFFDREWNLLRLNPRGVNAPADFTLPKPEGMDRMFEIASRLSKGLRYVRVDLYNNNGKIYFGEMTFFPSGGYDPNRLASTEERWGSLIEI